MTIYKFSRLTVPPTLEKRREALEAFHTLVSQDDELVRQRRAEIAAIRREAEDIRRCIDALCRQLPELSAERLKELKAQKYNPDQPRVPAGESSGGQWTREGGSGSSPDSMARPVAEGHPSSGRGVQYAALQTNVVNDAVDGASHSPTPQDSAKQRIQVAGNDWRNLPVNLAEEEAPNGPGHAISKHVAKTEAELRAQFLRISVPGSLMRSGSVRDRSIRLRMRMT
ncbi:MAG TPA: hypothetical protein VFA80_14095 [Xanthobacteraceae bacterium]|nr:hypothetical protein [Xanthobacteraceae bacterium]